MDRFGNVLRDFLKKAHADQVKNAVSLGTELRQDEGMNDEQIEEMLYASGFEADVIAEAMDNIPTQKNNKKKH